MKDSSSPALRCTAIDCERLAVARGMCGKHYRRWHFRNPDQVVRCAERQDLRLPDDERELAYTAGLIDGEGTIRHARNSYWQVRISMTDKEIIDWLSEMGGTVNREHRPPRKPIYVWQLNAQGQVLTFLQEVLPYMKLCAKRDRARAAIEELALRRLAKGEGEK